LPLIPLALISTNGAATGQVPMFTNSAISWQTPPAGGGSSYTFNSPLTNNSGTVSFTTNFFDARGATNIPITALQTLPIVSVKHQTFSTSGTYTPSTGMSYCIVECVGGGGAGGGTPSTSGSQIAVGGTGGAGGYSRGIYSSATIGASQSVTIGSGGTGVSASTGNTGGTTSFGSLITCNGGVGGGAGTASSTWSYVNIGGAGGSASGGNVANFTGATGQPAAYGYGLFGFFSPGTPSHLGSAGAGGSSLQGNPSSAAQSGNAGNAGMVIITEFCTQ